MFGFLFLILCFSSVALESERKDPVQDEDEDMNMRNRFVVIFCIGLCLLDGCLRECEGVREDGQ